mmetsp:Transcript_56096/g.121341  ORF Transcript_56096/g.121341 Transcript_56096/m.121341 type:complete len:124 (-) Transcript_56096:261-632(-)
MGGIHAKDLVAEDDIQTWVAAVLKAARPVMDQETREILLFAMKEHQKVLAEQTLAMMRVMEVQSIAMQRTLEHQGRMVSRILAIGGLTGGCHLIWRDLRGQSEQRRWLAGAYAVGVLGILAVL